MSTSPVTVPDGPHAGTEDDLFDLATRRRLAIREAPDRAALRTALPLYGLAREYLRAVHGPRSSVLNEFPEYPRDRILAALTAHDADNAADVEDAQSQHFRRLIAQGVEDARAHPWRLRRVGPAVGLDEDDEPDDAIDWRIERLAECGHRVVLAAQSKAGKTTLVINLIRALVDGAPFLGAFPVKPLAPGESVFVINVELSGKQFRRWLRRHGVRNVAAVKIMDLREIGPWDPRDEQDAAALAEQMAEQSARVLIVDPTGSLMDRLGLDTKSAAHVRQMFAAFDLIADEGGADEVIHVHHMNNGTAERSSGSYVWRGTPDVEWIYTVDKDGTRHFGAFGRDIDVQRAPVAFDLDTLTLTLGEGHAGDVVSAARIDAVAAVVAAAPGIVTRALRKAIGGRAGDVDDARDAAVRAGKVHAHKVGNATRHHAPEPCPTCGNATCPMCPAHDHDSDEVHTRSSGHLRRVV